MRVLGKRSIVMVATVASTLVGAGTLLAGGPSSPTSSSPSAVATPSADLDAAIARTKAAIEREQRALNLIAAYRTHGKTSADAKVLERSVVTALRAAVSDLDASIGSVNAYGSTNSDSAAPMSKALDTAIGADAAAIDDALKPRTAKRLPRALKYQRRQILAGLAAKKAGIALMTAAIDAPKVLYMVGTYNHVKPGFYSHFCLNIETGLPHTKVKVRLTGPGVQGSEDMEVTTGDDGKAEVTWTITQTGRYDASATAVDAMGHTIGNGNGSLDVTSAPGDASCK
jgi:hypothetical protein